MKLLITTIAAVLVVGCGESQQSTPSPEAKPVEPVAEAAKPESLTAKAPDISIWDAARAGSIEAVKQFIADGADVNAKAGDATTPLHFAAVLGHTEIAELLIAKDADVNAKADKETTPLHLASEYDQKEVAELLISKGADVNAKYNDGDTPLDRAIKFKKTELADLLLMHGGKTGEELKAEGK